jgi:hypothetical protein
VNEARLIGEPLSSGPVLQQLEHLLGFIFLYSMSAHRCVHYDAGDACVILGELR